MDSHVTQCACSAHRSAPSVHQTLDEMEFERGIWSAALDGDLEKVRSFLRKGIDPNLRDQSHYTALHYAGRAGHLSVCMLLLDCGACVNAQTRGGATPLHRSAYCGHVRVVKVLLDRGADPHLTDDDGTTPLHKAAEQKHLEVCELLVNRFPVLRSQKDKRSHIPFDVCPEHNMFWEFLRPPRPDLTHSLLC
ncbi:ankyrin repeat domain-containing protein 39 [Triplophysa rosa]|nr:ankyrin repeat domain-containing protein 39 [Triplophysa rosa]XP_057212119.1 ankyrin repeat domain-containing protein 39 [Triplophysa rosa]XP_057212120.1 ankyrin repeat domain-containing protein 39 [Triplophysa rosa]XP_057212121.1 ankyrin repeat domain-containing protein 39 [Triplophysa rosa]